MAIESTIRAKKVEKRWTYEIWQGNQQVESTTDVTYRTRKEALEAGELAVLSKRFAEVSAQLAGSSGWVKPTIVRDSEPFNARDAIRLCDAYLCEVDIHFFLEHGLTLLYTNRDQTQQISRSNAAMQVAIATSAASLFLGSGAAVASLNELEQILLEHGEVKDFQLISGRSSSPEVVDARLVKWAGMNARLTIYKRWDDY